MRTKDNQTDLIEAMELALGRKIVLMPSMQEDRVIIEITPTELPTLLRKIFLSDAFDFHRLVHLCGFRLRGRPWWSLELRSQQRGCYLNLRMALQEGAVVESVSTVWPSAAAFEAQMEFMDGINVQNLPARSISYAGQA